MSVTLDVVRDENWDIYMVNADGTGDRRLTNSAAWEALPTWSPDGLQIVFCTMTANTYANRGISVMNANGTGMHAIIPGSSCVNEDPAWSPDGREIAFQSNRTGTYQIFVMNTDGTSQRNLSSNHANEYWPNWRPQPAPSPTPTPTATPTATPTPTPTPIPGPRVRRRLQRVE